MALSTDKKNIIYVKIINEPVPAWEPVNAILIKDNIYRIIDDNDSYHSIYNKWEFSPNSLVK